MFTPKMYKWGYVGIYVALKGILQRGYVKWKFNITKMFNKSFQVEILNIIDFKVANSLLLFEVHLVL